MSGKDNSATLPNQYPVIIAEWRRNGHEVVRVALDQYNGRHTINARVWYWDEGALKPTRTGLTLGVKHLPALAEALVCAAAYAQGLGLVQEEAR